MQLLTRKDIARHLCVSVWYIIRRERELGIDKARLKLPGRMVRFNGEKVRLILERLQQ